MYIYYTFLDIRVHLSIHWKPKFVLFLLSETRLHVASQGGLELTTPLLPGLIHWQKLFVSIPLQQIP